MEALYDQAFATWEAAKAAIDNTAKGLGCTIVIHNKKPSGANPTRIVLRCGKSRSFKSRADEDALWYVDGK